LAEGFNSGVKGLTAVQNVVFVETEESDAFKKLFATIQPQQEMSEMLQSAGRTRKLQLFGDKACPRLYDKIRIEWPGIELWPLR
jgi:hypothetical protein